MRKFEVVIRLVVASLVGLVAYTFISMWLITRSSRNEIRSLDPHQTELQTVKELLGNDARFKGRFSELPEYLRSEFPEYQESDPKYYQWNNEGIPYFFVYVFTDEEDNILEIHVR